jgi:hypothetical protein
MTTYTKEKNAVPKHVVRHDWFSINKGYSRIILDGKLKFRGSATCSYVRNDATQQPFYKSVCLKTFSYFEPKMEWKQRNPFK